KSTGTMRGIGWVLLTYDTAAIKLYNVWINEHDLGHLSGTIPILVMDVFEHAYMLDYGLKRADYIEAFFRALDWGEVQNRFDVAAAREKTAPCD
ncbi:MAG: Fe-Mn family superoxide dismutase, partial [Candidatus Omnitrophica bacterium]|nr:Fe-Mn family superoxide dismutase [Candidatus Omnitrophota bacterium]